MRPTALGSLTKAAVPVFAVLALLVLAASATIISVPDPYETIADGIAAASPGDTVQVACDTYYENGLVISSAITLTSDTGQLYCVTIDGEATGTVLTLTGASGAVVRGINFTNGAALFGAGVYVDSCDVAFVDCQFHNNTAVVEGGGLRYRYGNPDISGCDFIDNSAADRGGNLALYGTGGTVSECDIIGGTAEWGGGACVRSEATTEFSSCTFSGNHAEGEEGYGGGFYAGNNALPVLVDCSFIGNSSGMCGGAAASYGCEHAVFSSSSFMENTAQWGGAIYVADALSGEVTNSTFVDNEALGGGGVMLDNAGHSGVQSSYFLRNAATTEAGGGVLLLDAGDGAGVSGCTFEANTAVYGGGVAMQGGTPGMPVYECTFALNSVTGQRGIGAGIAVSGISVPIANNIIAFSTSGEAIGCESGGEVTANLCAIYGNAGGDWVGCVAGQESQNYNSDADPLFCDMYNGNLQLCENSYCHFSNNPSGSQIGANTSGCDACDSPIEPESWGSIKAMYR